MNQLYMEELLHYQNILLKSHRSLWQRYLFPKLKTQEKLLGIKGIRGVGKTTLLLQYLQQEISKGTQALYITAEHPYFYQHTLFELAETWYMHGGRLLLIDEVHKYSNWSRELKLMYDGFPELKVIFTSSSALDLYRGESDLSRRLLTQNLHGLSFREFLSLHYGINLDPIPFASLREGHSQLVQEVVRELDKPVLVLFKEYLQWGYFPFSKDVSLDSLHPRLFQIINTVLESDLSFIQDYSAANVSKIKRLLGVIAESVPFEPNISKIAEKMHLGRQTVNIFIKNLEDAKILNLLFEKAKGISQLQKPNKIYLENPNFVYALQAHPSIGTVRETFFLNQVRNSGASIVYSPKGDFLVDEAFVIEVGGKGKDSRQIKGQENALLALDEIEIGFANRIPLWLFGFMY
jgi:uncharacterized protein